jgi:very-short-patch-repair endonuclease
VVHRQRNVAEIDIPFLDLLYGVEIDGPPHLLPEVAARDRKRDRMLRRDCGIDIDRYLWFELEEEPARFVREVTTRLRDLRAQRS